MTTDAKRAYQLIKERIISLELAPGSVIQDSALIDRLGLGRTPIREALKLLESENLVVTVPRRGIFVSHVSITDLQQLCEIRVEIEGLAARLAAQRATEQEMQQLFDCCEHYSQRSHVMQAKERIALDRMMHRLVAVSTHNRYLELEVERFYDLSLRLWYLAIDRVRSDDVNLAAHNGIAKAIRDRDADRAESLVQEHIRDFQQRVKTAL